jgi:hypothetical protein
LKHLRVPATWARDDTSSLALGAFSVACSQCALKEEIWLPSAFSAGLDGREMVEFASDSSELRAPWRRFLTSTLLIMIDHIVPSTLPMVLTRRPKAQEQARTCRHSRAMIGRTSHRALIFARRQGLNGQQANAARDVTLMAKGINAPKRRNQQAGKPECEDRNGRKWSIPE